MSVRRRTWRGPDGRPREAFMIDVQIQLPTGEVRRVREVAPVQSRRAAERYEQQVRARLLLGPDEDAQESEVPHDSHPTATISPTPTPLLTPAPTTIPTAPRGGPRSSRRTRPTTTTPLTGPLHSVQRPRPAPPTTSPPALATARATPPPSASPTPTPSPIPTPPPTLADFAPRFLEHHQAKGNKPGELRAKTQILADHLIPAFGALALDRITARLIDAYKVDKQRPAADAPRPQPKRVRLDRPRKTTRGLAGLAPHTVNNHLTILRSLLHLAARWELIARVPAFEMVREDVHDPEFLTFDEARRMVAAAEPGWRTFLITAIGTGLRIGELRALRWQDVDLERARIRVARTLTRTGFDVPKSRRPRTWSPRCGSTRGTRRASWCSPARTARRSRWPRSGGRSSARPRPRASAGRSGRGCCGTPPRCHRPPSRPRATLSQSAAPERSTCPPLAAAAGETPGAMPGRAAQRGPELDGSLGHPGDPALPHHPVGGEGSRLPHPPRPLLDELREVRPYGLDLGPIGDAYVARLLARPAMQDWYAAALAEPSRDEPHDRSRSRRWAR